VAGTCECGAARGRSSAAPIAEETVRWAAIWQPTQTKWGESTQAFAQLVADIVQCGLSGCKTVFINDLGARLRDGTASG
jgi:hypothetical protein